MADYLAVAIDQSGISVDMDSFQREDMAKIDYISRALEDSCVVLQLDTDEVKRNIAKSTDWANDPVWLAYATRLDQSQIM